MAWSTGSIDRLDLLPHEDAIEAWDRAQRFGLKMDVERPRVKRTQRDTVEDLPPSSRKRAVKTAIARLTEAERDKYVFDNVEQSDQPSGGPPVPGREGVLR
jgi:hypothetical protein